MVDGLKDSLLLCFAAYVCESEFWLWCFVGQHDNHPGDALDGQFDQLTEHLFAVNKHVVLWPC